ncbi:MAG TPA: NAD(P)H-dependent oxidoreductase [Acidimicrobiales bacterium]|nr:NAD(P)H-dependent oxidoreductase [Acidimicrobiales bacterium]
MPLLQVIVASTRPGRVGRAVGEWFAGEAETEGTFDVELVDLAEVALPFFDEPKHPRLREYEHDHTKRWSATIERADAFAFVMPEYNFGYTAPLKNAIDFLWHEWNDKAVVLVGYGGVSAGTRAMQTIKPTLTSVKLHAVAEVPIPFVTKVIDGGTVTPNEAMRNGARAAIAELARVDEALAKLRG